MRFGSFRGRWRSRQKAANARPRVVTTPLLHLAGRLAAEGPPAQVFRGAVELLPRLLQADRVIVLRHEAAADTDRVVGDAGTATGTPAFTSLTHDEVEQVTAADPLGVTLIERRPGAAPLFRRLLDFLEVERLLAVPLRYAGTRVGLMLLGFRHTRELSAAELGMARGVADQLSLAVATGRLREDSARRTRELAALHSAALATSGALEVDAALRSICDQAAHAFDADGAAILLLNNKRTHLCGAHVGGEGRTADDVARWQAVRLPINPALWNEAAWTVGRTSVVTDLQVLPADGLRIARELGLHSLLTVRLRVGGRPGGLLIVGDRRPEAYSYADVPLAEALAEQASAAIDRARAYEELERSARKILAQKTELEGILTHLGDGLMLADTARRVTLINPSARAILRLSDGEVWEGRAEPDFWQDVTAEGEPLPAHELPLARALAGEPVPARDLELAVDGETRVISVSAVRLTTPSGKLHGAVALLRDMTELRNGQDRVAQSERLRALGEMASGVAHDFNNLLGVILGRCEFLLSPASSIDRAWGLQSHMEVIKQAALDGAETVKRLQAFSGVTRFNPDEPMDLGKVVHDVVEFSRPRWKDAAQQRGLAIAIKTAVEPLPPMQGNPAELREVLLNLVFNAVDAMPHGGAITLSAWRRGDEVLMRVQDTGIGMPESVRRRVFEPFFTTKGSSGAGLGLSMSYGIIQRMGGRIDVTSVPRAGTTFTITLPFRPAAEPDTAEAATEAGPLRVLVVDDEPQMLRTTRLMLEVDGHTAGTASTGGEALARLREHGSAGRPFDVILTDLGMPGMNGFQLIAAVRGAGITIPCVLVTGWGLEVSDDDLKSGGVDAVLSKPFSADQLRALLNSVTARRAVTAA